LAESGFWGNISLKLEDGRITHIRQEENFKTSELLLLAVGGEGGLSKGRFSWTMGISLVVSRQ
jgi:hypothetical protein